MATTRRAVTLSTVKTSGDLPKAGRKTPSRGRGRRQPGSGGSRTPKKR